MASLCCVGGVVDIFCLLSCRETSLAARKHTYHSGETCTYCCEESLFKKVLQLMCLSHRTVTILAARSWGGPCHQSFPCRIDQPSSPQVCSLFCNHRTTREYLDSATENRIFESSFFFGRPGSPFQLTSQALCREFDEPGGQRLACVRFKNISCSLLDTSPSLVRRSQRVRLVSQKRSKMLGFSATDCDLAVDRTTPLADLVVPPKLVIACLY